MPSSTSNSDTRLPQGNLLYVCLAGFATAAVVLLAWEGLVRAYGFRPSVQDDGALWCHFRALASDHKDRSVVFAGASRVQGGLRPREFSEVTGSPVPLQLAVGGCKPIPLMKDLAEDDGFNGLLIVGVMPAMIFSSNGGGRNLMDYVAQSKVTNTSPSQRVEIILRKQAQANLAYRLPALSPTRIIDTWNEGKNATQDYRLLQPDRCRNYDVSLLKDIDERRRGVEEYVESRGQMSKSQLLATIKEMESYVKRIQARGGRVVYLRMPSSGSVLDLELKRFPRETTWDVLAAQTNAVCIYFADYPELARYECPEGSHLAYQDAAAFTLDFAQILVRDYPDLFNTP